MRKLNILALLFSLTAVFAAAQDVPDPLAQYKWVTRPLVIFADSPFDPRYIRQMEMLAEDPALLEERDVVILVDTDPNADSTLRAKLRPNDFDLILIDKEGRIVLRKSTPWTPRELSRTIDKLPIRRDELSQR